MKRAKRKFKKLTYEGKPLVCAIVGFYFMAANNLGPTAKISGLILLCCGFSILYMRARYRGLIR